MLETIPRVRTFDVLDEAIEWAEDQIIYRYGGYVDGKDVIELHEQALLAGLSSEEIAEIARLSMPRTFQAGQRIVTTGEPASSVFFLQSGMVSVKLPSGVRLATLTQGMEFGEMAMIEGPRHADVWADTPCAVSNFRSTNLRNFAIATPPSASASRAISPRSWRAGSSSPMPK